MCHGFLTEVVSPESTRYQMARSISIAHLAMLCPIAVRSKELILSTKIGESSVSMLCSDIHLKGPVLKMLAHDTVLHTIQPGLLSIFYHMDMHLV